MKTVTFLVSCYNSANYMEQCVDSLLIAGDEAEILIVNDGSSDSTGLIADRYAEEYPNIVRVIHQENRGHGGCINAGIRQAAGVYFKVVDSDDRMNPEALKEFMSLICDCCDDDAPEVIFTNHCYYHEGGGRKRWVRFGNYFPEKKVFGWSNIRRMGVVSYIMIHNITFRSELFRTFEINLPESIVYEDNYLVCSLLPKCRKFLYLNLDLYVYTLGRADQSMSDESLKNHLDDQKYVLEKIIGMYNPDSYGKQSRKFEYFMRRQVVMLIKAYIFFRRRIEEEPADYHKLREDLKRFRDLNPVIMRQAMFPGMAFLLCVPTKIGRSLVTGPIEGMLGLFVSNLP